MKKLFITMASVLTILILTTFCFVGCSNSTDSSEHKPSDKHNDKPESFQYDITEISAFYNGWARFQTTGGMYGYMDVNGKVVIEPIYTSAQEDFDENAALVSKDGTEMLIDRNGNILTQFNFDFDAIGTFENGFIWVQTEEETISKNVPVMTYYNEKGQKVFSINNVSHLEELGDLGLFCEVVNHSISYSSFNQYGYAFVFNEKNGYSYQFKDNTRNHILLSNSRLKYLFSKFNVYV